MSDARDAVDPAAVDAISRAMAAKVGPVPVAPVTPPAPVAEAPKAPEAAPAETEEKPRNEKGQFQKQELTPKERGLLAAAKAEREKRKALEARLTELEHRSQSKPETKPVQKDPSEVLSRMSEETRKWAESDGKDWVDALIEQKVAERLGVLEPVIETVRVQRENEQKVMAFQNDLNDFVTDMALEGYDLDPNALVETIERFEKQFDVQLGSTNRKKFENAFGLLSANRPATPDPKVAEEAKAKEAAEKARAGGVAPGAHVTSPPPDSRGALQSVVRDAALKGDLHAIADKIGARIKRHPAFSGK